ncbi:Alkaline ceramidase 3 [Entomortierella beljakovae]|nr:Alkaline ceramidase 3 [Entomortierella beljakovae]
MAPIVSAGSSSAFDQIGYWSPNTASVDWCENNYVISFYVAEFWNTISNIACLAAALFGYYTFPSNERRFTLMFIAFGFVGLGSVLFHGTLRHKMQLLDELPMLYSATIILFILVEAKHGAQGKWFPTLLTLWIGMVLHVQQRQSNAPPNPVITSLIRRAFFTGLFAVSIWLIDLRLCEFINGVGAKSVLKFNPQLHAWWHVFSAAALYHAVMLIIYYHFDVKGQKPYIEFWRGYVPVVRLGLQQPKGIRQH